MTHRFVFEEDFGWPMRVFRALIWAPVMALFWVLPWIAFFGIALLDLHFAQHGYFSNPMFGIVAILFVYFHPWLFVLAGASFAVGGMIGMIIGASTQPDELLSPLRSRLIRFTAKASLGLVGLMGLVYCAALLFP